MYLYHSTDKGNRYWLVNPDAPKQIAVAIEPGEYVEFAKCGIPGNPNGHSLILVAQVKRHLIGRLGRAPSNAEINAHIAK